MNRIFSKISYVALAASMLTSCSSDYLDLAPMADLTSHNIATDIKAAEMAMVGLVSSMYQTYSVASDPNGVCCGDISMRTMYGEVPAPDMSTGVYTRSKGCLEMLTFRDPGAWWSNMMWRYGYNVIYQANQILAVIDNIEGNQDKKDWIKAQALGMRAYAYWRMLQVYGPRWEDSNNGQTYCIILNLDTSQTLHDFSTNGQVLDQVYKDLDEAIALFERSSEERSKGWLLDAQICKGLKARAALIKNDWETVRAMAHDAREGYPVMTMDDCLKGFNSPNKEWIWYGPSDEVSICGYAQFGADFACNGYYPANTGQGCAMDWNLLKQIPKTDIRTRMFFCPNLVDMEPDVVTGRYAITSDDFFDSSVYKETTSWVSYTSGSSNKNYGFYYWVTRYGDAYIADAGGSKSADGTVAPGAYARDTGSRGWAMGMSYKFIAKGSKTTCVPPYMRGSEMLLSEAEALCHLNRESEAKDLLVELMKERDPEFQVAAGGEALMDQIKLLWRIEFWGEGFAWFNLKRWHMPVERYAWDGTPESKGSWISSAAGTFAADDPALYGWRPCVPAYERDLNPMADMSKVGQ